MSWLSIFFIFICFLGPSSKGLAAELCSQVFAEPSSPTSLLAIETYRNVFNSYVEFDYSAHENILFLSDGGKYQQALATNRRVYKKTDQQMIVSSDFDIAGSDVQVDNNKLPFRSNSFDFIVMNHGLCLCRGGVSCGGISAEREAMKNFLLSVLDVLNKNDSRSLAVLTGFEFRNVYRYSVPQLWSSVIREIQNLYPDLQFAILTSAGNVSSRTWRTQFIGIAIGTANGGSLTQKISELHERVIREDNGVPITMKVEPEQK
ncbi:MAG TPA: hypothetical protein VN132_14335 [Bdellovibrio sp.]|nr:hypothetical protein [Bdellovibrio sp.]